MPSIRKEGCVSSILLGFSHVMCTWVPALVLAQILIQSVRGWVWDSAFSANSQATSLPLVCSPHFDLDPKPVAATEGTRPRRWCEHSSNHGWFPWQQFFRGTPSAQPPPTRSRLSEPHHPPTLPPVKTCWKLALKRRNPAVRHLVSPTAVHPRGSTLVSTLF